VIAAVVLAAGKSERMGRPKMALAWGESTVLGTILQALASATIQEIRVVTGASKIVVEDICTREGVKTIFNGAFAEADMLSSIQVGISALPTAADAALIVLGDQPQIQVETVRRLAQVYELAASPLVVPSHNMRRGHPWLIDRGLWPELLRMSTNETARDFLIRNDSQIHYVEIDSATILDDLDTPGDYLKSRP
jgi:molybdenum cofactor cytidylyltransferase